MVVQEKGVKLPAEVYDSACKALGDDYQCVRAAALFLIKVRIIGCVCKAYYRCFLIYE